MTDIDLQLQSALDALVDPVTRGDPESPLRWTCKSTAKLAKELTNQQHPVTARTVARLLKDADYSLQANRKTTEGKQHPDRNAQFQYIHDRVLTFGRQRQPVISVDTKKKELVGDFRNASQEWQPQGQPIPVQFQLCAFHFPNQQIIHKQFAPGTNLDGLFGFERGQPTIDDDRLGTRKLFDH